MRDRFLLLLLAASHALACAAHAPPPRPAAEEPIGLAPSPPEPVPDDAPPAPASSVEPAAPSVPEASAQPAIAVPATGLPGGGVHAADPVALVALALRTADLGADAALVSITADGVSSAGTVDLHAGTIRYRFRRRQPAVQGGVPVPIASSGSAEEVAVTEVLVDGLGAHKPTVTTEPSATPVPAPRCSTKKLWASARHAGAPADALAVLIYDNAGGPRWELQIAKTATDLFLREPKCTVEAGPAKTPAVVHD